MCGFPCSTMSRCAGKIQSLSAELALYRNLSVLNHEPMGLEPPPSFLGIASDSVEKGLARRSWAILAGRYQTINGLFSPPLRNSVFAPKPCQVASAAIGLPGAAKHPEKADSQRRSWPENTATRAVCESLRHSGAFCLDHTTSLQNRRNSQLTQGLRRLGGGGVCSPSMAARMAWAACRAFSRSPRAMATGSALRSGML